MPNLKEQIAAMLQAPVVSGAEVRALLLKVVPCLDAMQTFCERVEADEVRSIKTYASFKNLLKGEHQ